MEKLSVFSRLGERILDERKNVRSGRCFDYRKERKLFEVGGGGDCDGDDDGDGDSVDVNDDADDVDGDDNDGDNDDGNGNEDNIYERK